jgi:hypothetical protein
MAKFKLGDMVKIKRNSPVFQDHRFYNWPEIDSKLDVVFEISELCSQPNRVWLKAEGYGLSAEYGNGRIAIDMKYLKRA